MEALAVPTETSAEFPPVFQKEDGAGDSTETTITTDTLTSSAEETMKSSPNDDSDDAAALVGHSKVSFGTVNVHKHRMTLGTNPSTAIGVPVELAWDEESSEFVTVEEYEKQHDAPLRRIPHRQRQEIAEVHHTRESLSRAREEVAQTQRSIAASASEDPDRPFRQPHHRGRKSHHPTSCCTIL